jgi:hypothetical protein
VSKRRDIAGQMLMPWADICCAECGRKLKSEHSQQRRMGRRCWRRRKEEAKVQTHYP